VALGTTAGVGGASRILGVLRREELDLRGPGYAVVALVTATGCGYWAAARRLRNGVAQAGTGALCVFAVTCLILADGRLTRGDQGLLLESRGVLAGRALTLWQRATDRDGDGASARFGG